MSKGEPLRKCPVCTLHTAAWHCESDGCFWVRCQNKSCDVLVDLRRRIAYRWINDRPQWLRLPPPPPKP